MHGGQRGGGLIPRNFGPPTDDEPLCRVHYPSILNFNVHDAVIELILVGVVHHIGGTPQEGHYFAVVKDFEDFSCWLCDDNKVSKTTGNILLNTFVMLCDLQ